MANEHRESRLALAADRIRDHDSLLSHLVWMTPIGYWLGRMGLWHLVALQALVLVLLVIGRWRERWQVKP